MSFYDSRLLETTFPSSVVMPAVGVAGNTVAAWRRREGIMLPRLPGAWSRASRYSIGQVYELALVKTLVEAGMPVAQAGGSVAYRMLEILEDRASAQVVERDGERSFKPATPVPGDWKMRLGWIAREPEKWLDKEFVNRDPNDPWFWAFDPARDEPVFARRVDVVKGHQIADTAAHWRWTVFTIVNVTSILAKIDQILIEYMDANAVDDSEVPQ